MWVPFPMCIPVAHRFFSVLSFPLSLLIISPSPDTEMRNTIQRQVFNDTMGLQYYLS